MFYMDAVPKSDIKSDISFDISIKPTTWIGHYGVEKFMVEKSWVEKSGVEISRL